MSRNYSLVILLNRLLDMNFQHIYWKIAIEEEKTKITLTKKMIRSYRVNKPTLVKMKYKI